MRSPTKKNAWVCNVITESWNLNNRRIMIPTGSLKEAGFNLDNQYYVSEQWAKYGTFTITQDGSRTDISKGYSPSIMPNGYKFIRFNLKPFTKKMEKDFSRVVVEAHSIDKEIWVTPLFEA